MSISAISLMALIKSNETADPNMATTPIFKVLAAAGVVWVGGGPDGTIDGATEGGPDGAWDGGAEVAGRAVVMRRVKRSY